jgi:hypothetical protein
MTPHRVVASDLFPSRNSKCPCGGQRKAKACCQISKHAFLKKPLQIAKISGKKTNHSNSSCIASFTKDCSEKISGEHYFSKAILELVGKQYLQVTGWPYNTAKEANISINSLVVRCLCTRHNSQLAPLDQAATKLFKALIDFTSEEAPDGDYRLFNYWDIERWLIKTLIMAGEAGFLRANSMRQVLSSQLKQEYLNILFLGSRLKLTGAGLYFLHDIGTPVTFSRNFKFSSNSSTSSNEVEGCTVGLSGFNFVFSPRKLLRIESVPVSERSFRPWRFVMTAGTKKNVIDLSVKSGTNHTLEIELMEPITS